MGRRKNSRPGTTAAQDKHRGRRGTAAARSLNHATVVNERETAEENRLGDICLGARARSLRGRDKRRGRDGTRVFHRVAFLFSSAGFCLAAGSASPRKSREGDPRGEYPRWPFRPSVVRVPLLLFFAHLAVRHTPLIIDRGVLERQGQRRRGTGERGGRRRRTERSGGKMAPLSLAI